MSYLCSPFLVPQAFEGLADDALPPDDYVPTGNLYADSLAHHLPDLRARGARCGHFIPKRTGAHQHGATRLPRRALLSRPQPPVVTSLARGKQPVMNSVLSRLLGRPRLDPRWIERVRRRYEVEAGYSAHHEYCRSVFQRELAPGSFALIEDGREQLRVMRADEAAAIESELVERFEPKTTKMKAQHLLRFAIDDPDFERRMLEGLLTPAVDERVRRFFGSEYFVYWYHATRSVPVEAVGLNSFRWHCDRGPQGHLKLLFYLNDWQVHQGGTEFLDLETTQRLAETGYVYAPVKTRVTDLADIARSVDAPYEPWSPRMKAGEGILFQPSNVLHQGRISKAGPRHVVTVCMLPSPIPWREAYERDVLNPLEDEDKWHDDASILRERLAPAS